MNVRMGANAASSQWGEGSEPNLQGEELIRYPQSSIVLHSYQLPATYSVAQ